MRLRSYIRAVVTEIQATGTQREPVATRTTLRTSRLAHGESIMLSLTRLQLPGRSLPFVFLALAACAGPVGDGDSPTGGVDVVADVGGGISGDGVGKDTLVSTVTDVDSNCPGGPQCPCAAADECDSSICLEGPDGKRCARKCVDSCPTGFSCQLVPGVDLTTVCISKWARLCSPCQSSSECKHPGLVEARCVTHGEAGSFCGTPCADASDCPTDHTCSNVADVDGQKSKQCVPQAPTGAGFGICNCNANSIALGLKTQCTKELTTPEGKLICAGTRTCAKAGSASTCNTPEPDIEKCDGVDNDCDGITDEDTCDDNKGCTVDSCDATAGCQNLPAADGLDCDADGTVCTEKDICKGGKCQYGALKKCDDGNPCTTNSCDKTKGCLTAANDGAVCKDNNPCTENGVCKGGTCTPGIQKVCKSDNQCVLAKCDVVTGNCAYAAQPTGTKCTDGGACVTDTACAGQVCAGKPKACEDGSPCTKDSCDNAVGCVFAPIFDVCDDGNACTKEDACQGGKCIGLAEETTVTCSDSNPCTTDSCDPIKGCQHQPATGDCDDGVPCTTKDICSAGECLGTTNECTCKTDADCVLLANGNPCAGTQYCASEKGLLKCHAKPGTVPVGKNCDDDDACSSSDTCKATGFCGGTKPTDCDDGNACTEDSCDSKQGCAHKALSQTMCNDGDVCTKGDTCLNGASRRVVQACEQQHLSEKKPLRRRWRQRPNHNGRADAVARLSLGEAVSRQTLAAFGEEQLEARIFVGVMAGEGVDVSAPEVLKQDVANLHAVK